MFEHKLQHIIQQHIIKSVCWNCSIIKCLCQIIILLKVFCSMLTTINVNFARNSKPRTAKRVLNLSRSENTSVYNLIQFQRRLCMLFLQDYKEIVKHSHKIIDTYNYIFCFSNNLCRYIFLTAEPGNCVHDMKKAVVHFLT